MKLAIIIPTFDNLKSLKKLLNDIGFDHDWWKDCPNDNIGFDHDWWKDCPNDKDLIYLTNSSPIEFTGWFFILNRKCLQIVGYFDEALTIFGSDFDFWVRFKRSGLECSKIDLHIEHGGSETIKKMTMDWYKKVWNENWNILRSKYPNLRMQSQLK